MAQQKNELIYKVGADTSEFQKSIDGAKSALRDFNSTSTNALQSLGDVLGINTGKIKTLGNAVKGLGIEMTRSSNEGVQAFGKLVVSVSKVGTAIAGLGITAAIGSFKALNAEAENFKNTVAGANLTLQTQAYLNTYKQTMYDMTSGTGESVANAVERIKQVWGSFTAQMGAKGRAVITNMLGLTDISMSEIDDQAAKAIHNAERAAEIQKEIFDIQRQQMRNEVEVENLTAKIREALMRVADVSTTAAEKQSLMAQAAALTEQKYALMVPLQQELANLIAERNALSSSSLAEENEEFAAQKQVKSLLTQKANEMREINSQQKAITAEVEKEKEAVAAIAASRASLADWASNAGAVNTNLGAGVQATTTAGMGIIPLKPSVDEQEWVDAAQIINSAINTGLESVSTAIGGLIGDLATGGDAWQNFSNSAVSAFGDMAIAIGKMAISTGIASKGIVKALQLQPELAIMAGAALVALGSAVKAGLKNISSGNYSSSSNLASSNSAFGGTSTSGYASSTINVNVTGKLVANGSTLAAVLESESNRKKATT